MRQPNHLSRCFKVLKVLAQAQAISPLRAQIKGRYGVHIVLAAADYIWGPPKKPKSSKETKALEETSSSEEEPLLEADKLGPRLVAALSDLGPSFVKLGQALSVRADLIGEDMATSLAALQDQMAPFPTEQAIAAIEEEFEQPITEIFRTFDPTPVAAASIAQVHFAEAHDGTLLAVKILRPDIEENFEADLQFLEWLAEILEQTVKESHRLRPKQVVSTVREWVENELDLRLEGAAAMELAENCQDDPDIEIPAIHWELTGQKILTMDRVIGFRIDDLDSYDRLGLDRQEILARAARSFFLQVFRDGFFHADMHPGNMLVSEAGVLSPVDFGIMGRIDRRTRMYMADMMLGFLLGDYERVADAHFRAGFVPPHKSRAQFTQALRAIGAPVKDKSLEQISVARLLQQLFATTERFQMPVQPDLLLLQKTMLVAEGVGRILDPGVNIWSLARPMIEEWFAQNMGVSAKVDDARQKTLDILNELPARIERMERWRMTDHHSAPPTSGFPGMFSSSRFLSPRILVVGLVLIWLYSVFGPENGW